MNPLLELSDRIKSSGLSFQFIAEKLNMPVYRLYYIFESGEKIDYGLYRDISKILDNLIT